MVGSGNILENRIEIFKAMTKRIVFFNHKGGVSKTTSTYNLGWTLAQARRVLLVDADPQCNLTSLILQDTFEEFYDNTVTAEQNLKDGVKVAFEGKPAPITAVECKTPMGAPNLFLLAGHANLSEYDAALTFAQTSNNAITTLQNLPGAFSELLRLTEERYQIEVTLIDMNPSLSAINQNFFITSHAFIIPTNPDPFSIMALGTLTNVLPRWVRWAQSMEKIFTDAAYPLPTRTPKFLGTLIQRFNVRRGRAAAPYRNNIDEIKNATVNSFLPELQRHGMAFTLERYAAAGVADKLCLQEIADFHGLLPKSQVAGVPVFALTNDEIGETGPVLAGLIEKRESFKQSFTQLADRIMNLLQDV